MTSKFVLAIDQGTTGTRAVGYQASGEPFASAYQEFRQYYPRPGWVEHDPLEIWRSTVSVVSQIVRRLPRGSKIAGLGITNQRETTVLWDRRTGKPVHPAIVWQDRRTASFCEKLRKGNHEKKVREKTGLVLDPYFSGTKIHWLLKNISGLARKAASGQILFGTIDTWLLWNLTGGKVHATDFTNASRTLLFNIHRQKWDSELLKIFQVPFAVLPRVQNSGSHFCETARMGSIPEGIPILSLIGDQQAALYGQGCYAAGEVKNTYGTGCFPVMNAGKKLGKIPFGLLGTLACDQEGRPNFAFEGSIFIGGAAIQWLRDGLHFFKRADETEAMVRRVKDSAGVVVIPALVGLGSPYWNPNVRGMISGLTRGTQREHIVRATLESIAHQSADVLECMEKGLGRKIHELKVDGGATQNNFLMQFQSDILKIPVLVSDRTESTAWGAAKLAGRMAGIWGDLQKIDRKRKYQYFRPRMKSSTVRELRSHWKKEVQRLVFS